MIRIQQTDNTNQFKGTVTLIFKKIFFFKSYNGNFGAQKNVDPKIGRKEKGLVLPLICCYYYLIKDIIIKLIKRIAQPLQLLQS